MSSSAHCSATRFLRSQMDLTLVPSAETAWAPILVPAAQIPLVLFVQDKVDLVV